MKKLILTIISLLFYFITLAAQNPPIRTFNDFEKAVNQLEDINDYAKAIELTQSVWDQFPDKVFELIKEMEYLNGKTEQYEKNLKLWESGHQQGLFFLLNKRMKQYEPYLQFTLFDSLVQKDTTLREAAVKEAKTIYHIVKPANFNPQNKYPLLLILHGGGSNMEDVKRRWKLIDEIATDYIVAYFQSYRHYDSKTFGWSSSDPRTHKEMKDCFAEIIETYPVDTLQVVIGGTSAGGTMAIDLAFSNTIPIQNIIGFCPGKPRDFSAEKIINKDIKIYMLGGETDFYLPKQKELAIIFDEIEVQYMHKIIPGMGHDFPKNYEQVIAEALSYFSSM